VRRAAILVALLAFFAATAEGAFPSSGDAKAPQVTRSEAIAAADEDPTVLEEERRHGPLAATASLNEEDGRWEVAYFSHGEELVLVYVGLQSGEVTESWTGYQVAWKMARGYSGAFGHKLNAPYVFIPLCLVFLLGLVDWRRLWRVANLDLLVLLGFGVSHYFFNRAEVGVSVPLVYPVLLYLLARSLWIGLRGRGEGLRPVWPVMWMIVAALFLMGFRVGLNIADAGAIDVGYAGVVGADKITHGEPIYDNFPEDIASGDTYGPVNYLAYVPFELVWPNHGEWDDLPAAHGAAVIFDIATFAFLILLGRRIRPGPEGDRLAATLAFGWAAYPYTAYVLESNSNDSLVAALLVATIYFAAKPLARGALLASAVWAKFVAAPLAPMLLTYQPRDEPSPKSDGRPALLFILGALLVTIAVLLWPALDPGLKTFYDRTVATQASRDSPFSIWGQTSLEPLRTALLVALGALSLAFAFVPRHKSIAQLAALSAALMILLQLTLHHWFYLYIVWFYPLLLIALAASPAGTSPPDPARSRRQEPPSPRRPPRPSRTGSASG
jgi:hypothetical protein